MEKRDTTEKMSSITPATATVAETSVEESQESSNTVGSDTVDTSKLGKLISKPNATSDVWKYFKVFEKNKNVAKCCVDNCDYVKEIKNGNTSHLRIHLQSQIHRGIYKDNVETGLREHFDTIASSGGGTSKRQIDGHFTRHHAPSFARNLIIWIAMTYQALSVATEFFFRQMCTSLNPKAEKEIKLGDHKIKDLILRQSSEVKVLLERLLKGRCCFLVTWLLYVIYLTVNMHCLKVKCFQPLWMDGLPFKPYHISD